LAKGKKMVAPYANWITRMAPWLEPFGILALLSALIAVPGFLMIRVLEPGLVLPALSILLFAEAAVAAIVARSINVHRNSDNLTVWNIAGAFAMMGCASGYAAIGYSHQAGPLWQPAGCDVGLELSWSDPVLILRHGISGTHR
jgi:hypothetical protein